MTSFPPEDTRWPVEDVSGRAKSSDPTPVSHARAADLGLGQGPEFDRIRELIGNSLPSHADVTIPVGDDCAGVTGENLLISTDLAIEGVHFQRDWLTPREIGYRAAAAALSDLAAMAAEPVGVLLSVALSVGEDRSTLTEIGAGVQELCESFGAAFLGGDLSSSPGPLLLDVVVVGKTDRPIRRSGAHVGDEIWVTGVLGGSGGGLLELLDGRAPPPSLFDAFRRPHPRIREALWLAEHVGPTAMLDISDGLASDAGHLASASGVRVLINEREVPIDPALFDSFPSGSDRPKEIALGSGEDFELVFSATPGSVAETAEEFRKQFNLSLTRVGRCVAGDGVWTDLADGDSKPLRLTGFDHFDQGNR